jgi:hypothetical protein
VRRIALLAICAASSAAAQTQPGASIPSAEAGTGTESWQTPTLTITRYDEHWEDLADPSARDGHWTERFKYIPLGSDAYLTTGLELRAHNEKYGNNLWGAAPAPDDGYLWLRALPYADLHAGRGKLAVRAFAQPIMAYAVGVTPSPGPIDQTRTDMLQGFADVRVGADTGSTEADGATIRFGRQMVSLGTERLVGTRYGPNVPLAFDGIRIFASLPGASATILSARPVQPGGGTFDDRRSRSKKLRGIYATVPTFILASGIDVYWLGYRNTAAKYGGISGDERRDSFGARLFGTAADWHWNVETVYQAGRFAGQRISAWTMGSEIGRRLPNIMFTPDAVLRVSVVSGDRRPGDGRLNTFNAMFPKGKYFGELSPVGPYNIISANPRVALALTPTLSGSIAGMAYWRYTKGDGIYDVPGNLIRAPGTATSRFIGKQVEATIAWQATPELEVSGSLSAFGAGAFIRQTGPARTITMLGLETNFRF